MEDIIRQKVYARIDQIMVSDNMTNLIVTVAGEKEKYNFKLETERAIDLYINCIYEFDVAKHTNSEKNAGFVMEYRNANDIEDVSDRNDVFRMFMKSAPIDYSDLKSRIESYMNKIDNKILSDIVYYIINKYKEDFYLYPAASKLHHAYVGGLAYHTLGMLDLVEGLAGNYPYLDKSLLYAGIILHDIGKVIEFTGVQNTEYAVEGQLLGHLLIGCNEISQAAHNLGYSDTEDVLLLTHMVASHHGQPMFGAIKRPAVPEAAMLWYIDTIDSKFRVLGEELNKTKPGTFTEPIGVMDKTKFYKRK